jgi:hypothetical protein
MSAPASTSAKRCTSSSADLRPISGLPPAPRPLGELRPELDLDGRQVALERLCIRVGRDELDAFEAARDHRVEGVAAAPTNTHHFDPRVKSRVVCKLNRDSH